MMYHVMIIEDDPMVLHQPQVPLVPDRPRL